MRGDEKTRPMLDASLSNNAAPRLLNLLLCVSSACLRLNIVRRSTASATLLVASPLDLQDACFRIYRTPRLRHDGSSEGHIDLARRAIERHEAV